MAWGFHSNRILKLQKKALRIITLSKCNLHSEPLYKKLGFLKVDDILFKLQQLKCYYKYLHDNLHTFRARHAFENKCLRHNLPLIVNNIPDIVKDKLPTHSLNGFAMYVKLSLLQTYNDAYTITNCYMCRMQN